MGEVLKQGSYGGAGRPQGKLPETLRMAGSMGNPAAEVAISLAHKGQRKNYLDLLGFSLGPFCYSGRGLKFDLAGRPTPGRPGERQAVSMRCWRAVLLAASHLDTRGTLRVVGTLPFRPLTV